MNPRLRHHWLQLRSSFWFVPALMTLAAVALAFVTVGIDDRWEHNLDGRWWLFEPRADGARAVLMTIAGSMITVAGVVFSILVVALTLASQQYGPRLLRGFMRDTSNQVVLGIFIATFLYSLLVLGTVQGGDESAFVPQLSVSVALVLAVASVGVLIYFLHHAATSIRSASVIAAAGRDLDESAWRTFPGLIGSATGDERAEDGQNGSVAEALPSDFDSAAVPIPSSASGYLQSIDPTALLEVASESDLVLRVAIRPGHHVLAGRPLAYVHPRERVTDQVVAAVDSAFILGDQRTAEQDVEFAIEELVEIAVRALSTGVNDPFTAILSIDRLTVSLAQLAAQEDVSPLRFDDTGTLRVVAYPQRFAELVPAAFNRLRQSAVGDVAVAIRLLESIVQLVSRAREPEARTALVRQAQMLVEEAERASIHPADLDDIRDRTRQVMASALLQDDDAGETALPSSDSRD
jgi:uncharacterized membrane protein